MLKKKLMPLSIELVVILNHLRVCCEMIFFVSENITILLFERNKSIIKILLKDTSKLQNCGSSVKVNGISDGILWDFM